MQSLAPFHPRRALLSVYDKAGLQPLADALAAAGVELVSTGGTKSFLQSLGHQVTSVESLTSFPEMLGGRVKTLHPAVFAGLLARPDTDQDLTDMAAHNLAMFQVVVVNLYPFEDTVASGASLDDSIEQIDIGGVALLRAAAKNHAHVLVVPTQAHYAEALQLLSQPQGPTKADRRRFAAAAFAETARYDTAISAYLATQLSEETTPTPHSAQVTPLRYGENPHQKAAFHGDLWANFTQLSGKELSYNNLLDIEAALGLCRDLALHPAATATGGSHLPLVIVKHNTACGVALRQNPLQAWQDALAADPTSAFGGVIATAHPIDIHLATAIDALFYEVLIAPAFTDEALAFLTKKKARTLLQTPAASANAHAPSAATQPATVSMHVRSALGGTLVQDPDIHLHTPADWAHTAGPAPTDANDATLADLHFANLVCKHTKSNAIVLAKNLRLSASGTGQTSRIDALNQAIEKATRFNMPLTGAVMASDAFFPFPDCAQGAAAAGISAIVHPGGSKNDQATIAFCNAAAVTLMATGIRHFRH